MIHEIFAAVGLVEEKRAAPPLPYYLRGAGIEIFGAADPVKSEITRACVSYISKTIASMPIRTFRKSKNGIKLMDNSLMVEQPHRTLNRYDFIRQVVEQALYHGVCSVDISSDGFLEFHPAQGRIIDSMNTLNFIGFTDMHGQPIPLYNAMFNALRLDSALQQNRIANAKSSIPKAGVKKSGDAFDPRAGKKTAEADQQSALNFYQQQLASDSPLVYLDGHDIVGISPSFPEYQWIDAWVKDSICGLFGLSASVISGKTTNAHESAEAFVRGVLPVVMMMNEEMSRKLARQRNVRVEFDHLRYRLDTLLPSERAGYYSSMMQVMGITQGEVRAMEGLAELSEADQFIINSTFMTQKMIDQKEKENEQGTQAQ